jgi:hypothetical protein
MIDNESFDTRSDEVSLDSYPGTRSSKIEMIMDSNWFAEGSVINNGKSILHVVSKPKSVWWRTLIYYSTFTLWDIRRYKMGVVPFNPFMK